MSALRNIVVAFVVLDLAIVAPLACGSFTGDNSPGSLADGGADESDGEASEGGPASSDATTDAGADGMAPPACEADAAYPQLPTSNLSNQTCNGIAGKNLTSDALNCGWCGHQCELGCDGIGHCTPKILVTGAPVVGNPASTVLQRVDDAFTYWTVTTPGAVYSAKTGDTLLADAATLLLEIDGGETASPDIYDLAIDDKLYAGTFTNLYTAPLDGGPLSYFGPRGGFGYGELAAVGPHLMETSLSAANFSDTPKANEANRITTSNLGGAYEIAVTPNGDLAFFIARDVGDGGSDTTQPDGGDASTTYYTLGSLYRYTLGTKVLTRVLDYRTVTDQGAEVLAVDDAYVYFAEADGSIMRLPVDANFGDQPALLSAGNGRSVRRVAVDADGVYFFSSAQSPIVYNYDLRRVSKCGGPDFVYADSLANANQLYLPGGLYARGGYLYWSVYGTIFRVAK